MPKKRTNNTSERKNNRIIIVRKNCNKLYICNTLYWDWPEANKRISRCLSFRLSVFSFFSPSRVSLWSPSRDGCSEWLTWRQSPLSLRSGRDAIARHHPKRDKSDFFWFARLRGPAAKARGFWIGALLPPQGRKLSNSLGGHSHHQLRV